MRRRFVVLEPPPKKRRVLRSRHAYCGLCECHVVVQVPKGSPPDYPLCFECPRCHCFNEQPV